jgi:hypothetical protein
MKEIFQKLALKGYSIYNKRVLGNPLYTSEETRLRDITQEIALVVEWLRVNHGIWVSVDKQNYKLFKWRVSNINLRNDAISDLIEKSDFNYDTPQEAYSAAFNYIISNNLI